MENMVYEGPTGEGPAGWEVKVQEATSLQEAKDALIGRYPAGKGPFHVLWRDGEIWMSDTNTEKMEMLEPLWQLQDYDFMEEQPRVLVHGLGLGLVVAAALRYGADVEVVELDGELVEWMSPWLTKIAAKHDESLLRIYVDDALTRTWPVGSTWNVVWHDIWPTIGEDNLPEMHRLHRSFGHRTDWQGSWQRRLCEFARSNW